MVIRDSPTQLPDLTELMEIMKHESQRRVPIQKLNSNLDLIDFSYLYNLFDCLQVDFDKSDFEVKENRLNILVARLDEYKQKLVNSIHKLDNQLSYELILVLNSIYDYLCEDDAQIVDNSDFKSDLAFVFGSKLTFRTDRAIELYKQGKVKKILITGSSPFYENTFYTEAETLGDYAAKNGVSRDDLIIENKSLSVPDNVKRSLDLFDAQNLKFNSIVLITSPFAMSRSYNDLLKFLTVEQEKSIQVFRANSSIGQRYERDNWYKYADTLNIVLNEYFKQRGEWLIDKYFAELEN